MEYVLMIASVAVAAMGWTFARRVYEQRPEIADGLAATFAGAHRVLTNKYYVDELYGAVLVRGLALGGGNALHAMDRFVVDGGDGEVRAGLGVNGVAWATRDLVASFSSFWDRVVVDGLVNLAAFFLDNMSYVFRAVQNGRVQHYALAMIIGFFVLIVVGGRFGLGLY
jgi:NADH-quinone oxidoreductase subunit L